MGRGSPNSTLAPTWPCHFGHRKFPATATATARPEPGGAFRFRALSLPSPGIITRPDRGAQIHTETSPARLNRRGRSDVSIENNTCRFAVQAAWEPKVRDQSRAARQAVVTLAAPAGFYGRCSGRTSLFEDGGGVWYKPGAARHAAPSVRFLLFLALLLFECLPSVTARRSSFLRIPAERPRTKRSSPHLSSSR